MKAINGIQYGILHADGTVTDPNFLKWKQIGEYKFISQKLNNGDWDYYLFIDTIDMEEAYGELGFLAEIAAVSIEAAGKANVSKAIESCGSCYDPTNTNKEYEEGVIAEYLFDYGVRANLWNKHDKNAKEPSKLIEMAKKESEAIHGLFGFYMDKAQNRIGATGWDFIKGEIMPKFEEIEEPNLEE